MSPPRCAGALLRWLVPADRIDDILGDLEEVHQRRVARRGRLLADVLTCLEAMEIAFALFRTRRSETGPLRRETGRGRLRPRLSGISWLDLKLGVRMLSRYPGLTVMAGVAMAFVIAVGAGAFQFLRDATYPALPLRDGDRIVRFQRVDTRRGNPVGVTPEDVVAWREALHGVNGLGAFHHVARNLWDGSDGAVPVEGLAVSPSAFTIAGVPPLLGRPLLPSDEAAGSPPVVLLGYGLWRSGFGADPTVVGRVVRLGRVRATIVGVMPQNFAFPEPGDIYVPLGLGDLRSAGAKDEGAPRLIGFGKLANGATLEQVRQEVATLAATSTGRSPDEPQHLKPEVAPFAYPLVTTNGMLTNVIFGATVVFLVMLVGVVAANVALLMYARAAAREGEIAVRAALGAGRARIVAQLFAEALVLIGVATAGGLAMAASGLRWALHLADPTGSALPFWIRDTLSTGTIGWAVLLGVIGAGIAGVTPALQVTGRDLHARLQRGSGRGSGVRLGGVWTAIVVSQVALTVIFTPVVIVTGSLYWRTRTAERGVASKEYLALQLDAQNDTTTFEEAHTRLRARLAAEPWLRGLAVADRIWPVWRSNPVEVEGLSGDDSTGTRGFQHLAVSPGFFGVMGARPVAGRVFSTADIGRRVAVVDEAFVREMLSGRNAVGRRIRPGGGLDDGTSGQNGWGPWYEIVGVVRDLGLNPHTDLPGRGVMYEPLPIEHASRLALIMRVSDDPGAHANRVRVLSLQTDPTMHVETLQSLDDLMARPAIAYGAWFRVVVAAGALAMLLTLAGIYSVMAFSVARRTQEIGVRVALGADHRHVANVVLSRAFSQVGYGVLLGGIALPLLMLVGSRILDEPGQALPPLPVTVGVFALYLTTMAIACMLACVVPLRRALRVQPTEALATDA